jgi:hypothetical protein
LLLVYVGIVVIFESTLGYYQPQSEGTLLITTTDDDGNAHTRVLSRIVIEDTVYIAANHWPRAWYREALDNPDVTIDMDGESRPYRALPVTPAEDARLRDEQALPLFLKFLMGFAPRRFLRLDPVS